MRRTLGTLAVAVLLTFAAYMAVFGRDRGPHPEPTAGTAAPSPSTLVAAALPELRASALIKAWEKRWKRPVKQTARQAIMQRKHPDGDGRVRLTMTRVPEDSEAVWGVSCARHGKPAPYSKDDLTELLDFCLPPEVAGDRRREVVAWLSPLNDATWRVHRQFDGFTAVVQHSLPKADRAPVLQLALTGGTYFPA
ncbi:hypothetical protein AB0F81_24420 [Actinoplanes sp. NPDC024001]|uniref:hypothetical protein n=1 Tax=Actinoplanes sp. NPDC024001 TaxID=3154598 RepID=UPI00340DDF69